ncbi:MAG TPA: polysaccharide deacetylase family protein, partial [Ignavibacteriaceae bacterium]|nr:polysaccharide deacetylase family protein [Ignavibacteriaceae bacterium]
MGVSYLELSGANLHPEDYVSVIVSEENIKYKNLENYLNEGGTVIGGADMLSKVLKTEARNNYIKYFLPSASIQNLPPCDIYKSCFVPADANSFPNQENMNTWKEFDSGKGRVIMLPSGIASLMNDRRIKRKNFYSACSRKEMNERVSAVSKGSIYHYLQRALENLFHFRNLPFISLWPFPDGRQNIFGFRIDTDFADLDDLQSLYSVCRENNIKASWFVETGSSGDKINFYKKLENQEIGLHCNRHKVFRSYKKNYENISQGLKRLKKIDIRPAGFAAPYGEFNNAIGKVINDMDFVYSSEFGFAYDSLPFYPYLDNSYSRTLQIPIHPVSIGRLYWG